MGTFETQQFGTNQSVQAASISASLSSLPAVYDVILAFIDTYHSSGSSFNGINTPTDNQSGVWNSCFNSITVGTTNRYQVFYCRVTSALTGTYTVTHTPSNNQTASLILTVFRGVSSLVSDGVAASTTSGSGALTPAGVASSFAIGAAYSVTCTSDQTTFTSITNNSGSGNLDQVLTGAANNAWANTWISVSAGGTQTTTWTYSPSETNGSAAVIWLRGYEIPTHLCGFEMGIGGTGSNMKVPEANVTTGTVAVQTTTIINGSYSLRANPSASNGFCQFRSRAAGGTFRTQYLSARFKLRVGVSLPSANCIVAIVGGTGLASQGHLRLDTDGSLTLFNVGAAASQNSTAVNATFKLSTATTYRIDLDNGYNAGNGIRVYVNGTLWASVSTGTPAPTSGFAIGAYCTNNATTSSGTADLYFDDVLCYDTTLGGPISSDYKVICLLPTADSSNTNFTGGAGGTTSLFDAVNNVPPAGLAASWTNTSEIKCASNTNTSQYTATMQTYTAGGVGASDTVLAVQPLVNHAEEIATGTKTGNLQTASNPLDLNAALTFDYGDDSGAISAFTATTSTWRTATGGVTGMPAAVLGTAPTVQIMKTDGTTRVAHCDFIGLYVAVQPSTGVTVTKDVTSTGAVTVTVTKDVTSTGAVTRTVTKDVTTTAAVQTTVTKDVTSTSAVTRAITSDVTSTAALARTLTADVTSSAAVQVPAQTDVTSDASVALTTWYLTSSQSRASSEKVLNTRRGDGLATTFVLTSTAVNDRLFSLSWLSLPLKAVTISGPITFNLWGYEETAAANAGLEVELIKVSAGGSNTVLFFSRKDVELGTTPGAQTWSATPASPITISDGDRILLFVYAATIPYGTNSFGASLKVNLDYGATSPEVDGDSFLMLTEQVVFSTGFADVASTAVATRAPTKDVATTTATTVSVTSDVTSTGALSQTAGADVTSTLVTTRTPTAEVASTGVTTAPVTSDVTTDTVLTRTVTAEVATAGVVSTGVSADVSSSAETETTTTASVTSTGAVEITTTTDVDSDAGILVGGVGTAEVTTTGATTARFAESVTTTGAVTMTASADLDTDADVSQAVSANVASTSTVTRTGAAAVTTDASQACVVTADVTSTTATERTSSADATTTGALTRAVTASVTSTGAVTQGASADLTSTAATTQTGMDSVTTDASTSAPALANVTTTAATTANVTASVTTDADVATGHASEVDTSAAVSQSAQASVNSAAATTAPATNDVASSAAVERGVAADLDSTANLSQLGTTDLTTDAALSQTAAYEIATDAALTHAEQSEVVTSAALSRTVDYDVATNAAIRKFRPHRGAAGAVIVQAPLAEGGVVPEAATATVSQSKATAAITYRPAEGATARTPATTTIERV